MPTFGDTSLGTNTFPMNIDRAIGSIFTLSEAATVTGMYIGCDSAGTDLKGIVYSVSAGVPATLQLVSSVVASVAAGYAYATASGSLSAGDYFLGSVANGYNDWRKDVSGGPDTLMANGTLSYASPPSSWPGTDGTYGGQANVYLEYTTAGGSFLLPSRPYNYILVR